MSWELLSDTEPIARQAHKCVWCGGEIAKGAKHHVQTGKMAGEFHSNRYHPECMAAAVQLWAEDPDDGFDAFSFKRGTTEEK